MKYISNWKQFILDFDPVKCEVDKNIVAFMKNAPIIAATGAKLIDEIKRQQTDIEILAYEYGEFCWDSRDVFYYEKYGMPISSEFIAYVKSR